MALSLAAQPDQLQAHPQPTLQAVPLSRRLAVEADLGCLMCGRTVGMIVKGRAYHSHGACTSRLRVEGGLLRCCQCSGPVYREPVASVTLR